MKMKKKEKPSENLDNYCSRPVKAELPKVWGGDDKRLDTSYAFYIH